MNSRVDTDLLSIYLPLDRRHALATGRPPPDQTQGTALLTDSAGFTPPADALLLTYSPRRGAEEVTRLLNAVYEQMVKVSEAR